MDSNTLIPQAFIDKMATIMPAHLDLDEFISACRRPLRKALRVNTLKISVSDFKEKAQAYGWQLTPIPWCAEGFWIEVNDNEQAQEGYLGNSPEHLAGLCYIQEASSMLPVSALFHFFSSDDESVLLDAAAAPGSKTTQIAALMHNQGLLIANEYSSSRIKMLHANIQRCGIHNVALSHFDANVFGTWLPETFDAILLDAPCSGEGTVRKDKQALHNWDQASIDSISDTQKNLIDSAFQALKPNGVMAYSTCTLSLEENQQICFYLKHKYPANVQFLSLAKLFQGADKALTDQGFLHIWPQLYDTEGFFVAVIKKLGSIDIAHVQKKLGKFPFQAVSSKLSQTFYSYLNKQFKIKTLPGVLYQRDKELWLFPEKIVPLISELRFSRLGIKVAEQFGQANKLGFKVTHEFARAFSQLAQTNIVELDKTQAASFYQGKDIQGLDNLNVTGEVLVCYQGFNIGLGKALKNNRLKNNLPRELTVDKAPF